MKQCSVFDENTKESETFYSLTAAKKWMRERIKKGHKVRGSQTKIWSNGEWENLGEIKLTESNKHFVANTRQTKKGY